MKYNVSKEFGFFAKFTPPFNDFIVDRWAKFIKNSYKVLKKDKDTVFERVILKNYELIILRPIALKNPPVILYLHGGAFVFPAYKSHYKIGLKLCKEAGAAVVFVNYRLAPDKPFPAAEEDCNAALLYIIKNAQKLGIDADKIALVGDSAGGNLAAQTALFAKRCGLKICCQMYLYPVMDPDIDTPSKQNFTDTPMWNSVLNERMWDYYFCGKTAFEVGYRGILKHGYSPLNVPFYIEAAEFDCLKDEAILFYEKLNSFGVKGEFHLVEGAMHGFDIVDCPKTKEMISKRADFIKKSFGI